MERFTNQDTKLSSIASDLSACHFKNPAKNLPSHFIPEIMPMKHEKHEATSIVKSVGAPIVAVSLQNFFRGIRETSMLKQARKSGLHKFLDYYGKVVLTTDVKDRLCDHFVRNPTYFKSLVEAMNPDYLTTFDTYTYGNIPAGISRIKMLEVESALQHLLDLDLNIIGLALGATPDQVFSYTQLLMNLGCKIIAHPVYEFRKRAEIESIRWRIRLSKKLGLKTLLLSCSPGFRSTTKVYSDYYSSWSWFSSTNSKDSVAYTKRRKRLMRMLSLSTKCSQQTKLGA